MDIQVRGADRDTILRRVASGEYATKVSESLGLERSTVSQALRNDPDYQAAKELGMECRLDDALALIEQAGDDINLARAREILARRLEWRAEREHPHRWGQREQRQAGPAVAIQINLRRDAAGQQEVKVLANQGGDSADSAIISEG